MTPSVWIDPISGNRSEWVDIRTRFVEDGDSRPTKIGVKLRLAEFRMILPMLRSHKEGTFGKSADDQEFDAVNTRKVQIKKHEKLYYVMNIILQRPDKDEVAISLTFNEIDKIWRNKEKIECYFINEM